MNRLTLPNNTCANFERMLKPTIFREYDIRGVADEELLSPDVEKLGQAIGTYIRQRTNGHRVVVGRDVRLSSPRLRDAVVAGLQAAGCQVTDLGIVPTPLTYYAMFHLDVDGGVMITGSHNPPEYNGFKILCGKTTIYGQQIQELRQLLESGELIHGQGSVSTYDIITPYVNEVTSQLRLERKVKLVADAGNGTAGPVFHRILEKLNVEAVELFFEMDGRFPNHHPDQTIPKNLEALIAKVKETGAELGVAFDGDADRVGAIDEQGNILWGDQLTLIYAREILKERPGATFIADVKCSQVLFDQLKKMGGNPIMWKTGHSLIKAKLKETGAVLAGEMSGHMFFADRYYGYDDAIYAACRLIEVVSRYDRPVSQLLSDVPKMVATPEIRVDCPDELKFEIVKRAVEHFRQRFQVIDVDGARILFPRGWGLVRASNTQPVLVLRFEAETKELLEEYRREVETALEKIKQEVAVSSKS